MRFRIPKELSEGQKLFKVGPVALDKRQGVIVLATFLGYGLAYKQLSKVIALNPAQTMAVFAPIFVLAIAVAFVRPYNRVRRSTLLGSPAARRPGVNPGARKGAEQRIHIQPPGPPAPARVRSVPPATMRPESGSPATRRRGIPRSR